MKQIRCVPTHLGRAIGDTIVADSVGNTAMLRTGIRGQGCSHEGAALTTDQSLGQHTSYLGSSIVGAMATNKDAGNDVIYARAGDDLVNAMNLKVKRSYKSTATARFASEKLCFSQRKRSRALNYLGPARLYVPRCAAPTESDCDSPMRRRERSGSGRRTNRANPDSFTQKFGVDLWLAC